MKKVGFLLVMAALLSGCATLAVSKLTANNRMNLVNLSRGMSKPQVLALMGSGISVYNCDKSNSKTPLEVTINNPYRTETIQTSGRTLEIIYYVTDIKNNNCTIEDDELTPLVFEDAKLIGWGKNFVSEAVPAVQKPLVQQEEKTQGNQQIAQSVPTTGQTNQAAQESTQKTAESNATPAASE